MLVTRLTTQGGDDDRPGRYGGRSQEHDDELGRAVANARWKRFVKPSVSTKIKRLGSDGEGDGEEKEPGDDFAAVVSGAMEKASARKRRTSLFGAAEAEEQRQAVRELDAGYPRWQLRAERRAVREFFDDPHSSKPAFYAAIFILVMIVASSITFCTETLPDIRANDKAMNIIFHLDYVFIAVFSAEYLIRFLAADNQLKFVASIVNMIDLMSVLPFYIDLAFSNAGVDLRFLRLARVFRIFKLSRYGNKMDMVVNALVESKDILGMLGVNLVIVIVVFSSITYFAEKDAPKDTHECPIEEFPKGCSEFRSIFHACWWCIVTVLTVGYGDMAPNTLLGKMTATVLMVLSLIVLALPITIIGSCFSNQWVQWKSEQRARARVGNMNKILKEIYPSLVRFLDEFADHNYLMREKMGDSIISIEKLKGALKTSNFPLQQNLMAKIKGSTDMMLMALDERLGLMSNAIDDILNKIRDQQSLSAQLKREADRVLGDAEVVLKQAMREMINTEARFAHGERHLRDFHGMLVVHLIGGKNLVARDMSGSSDPYVILRHGSEEAKSKVAAKCLSPLFDERIMMVLRNKVEPLNIEVMDHDEFNKDDSMGAASVFIEDLEEDKPREMWVDLTGVESGKVKIELTFRTFKGFTAEDLDDKDTWNSLCQLLLGASDPREMDMASALKSLRGGARSSSSRRDLERIARGSDGDSTRSMGGSGSFGSSSRDVAGPAEPGSNSPPGELGIGIGVDATIHEGDAEEGSGSESGRQGGGAAGGGKAAAEALGAQFAAAAAVGVGGGGAGAGAGEAPPASVGDGRGEAQVSPSDVGAGSLLAKFGKPSSNSVMPLG